MSESTIYGILAELREARAEVYHPWDSAQMAAVVDQAIALVDGLREWVEREIKENQEVLRRLPGLFDDGRKGRINVLHSLLGAPEPAQEGGERGE